MQIPEKTMGDFNFIRPISLLRVFLSKSGWAIKTELFDTIPWEMACFKLRTPAMIVKSADLELNFSLG